MFEDEIAARPFAEFALGIMASRKTLADAEYVAQPFASARVLSMLRALPGVTTPASPGWGAEISGAEHMVEGLFASLGNFAFNQLLPAMRQVPQRTRLVASTSIAGDTPGEGAAKTVFSLDLADGVAAPKKGVCTIVISAEMARSPLAVDFLNGELRNGVGLATDQAFIPAISSGAPSAPASGTDAEAFRYDVGIALGQLGLGAASRPFLLMAPERALALSLMSTIGGAPAFPDMTTRGGFVAGVPVVVTDALAGETSPATESMVAVDASGLAVDPGELLLSAAEHAVADLGGATVSLWAENLLGLRAERLFAASVARPGAVAKITGTAYGSAEV